jgi:hypothetical protein
MSTEQKADNKAHNSVTFQIKVASVLAPLIAPSTLPKPGHRDGMQHYSYQPDDTVLNCCTWCTQTHEPKAETEY